MNKSGHPKAMKKWERRKLLKVEIHSIYSSSNITRAITWCCDGSCTKGATYTEEINKRFCLKDLPEKYHFGDKCCMGKLYQNQSWGGGTQ